MDGYSHASGNPYNRLKYSGKELDEENGLYKYHFGWRDYYPELGRWVVVDPARQFASPYVFNGNTAINGYDSDGRFFFSALIPGLGTVIDAAMWGAAIGSGVSAGTYAITSSITGDFSLNGLGNAMKYGAISGAITGGIGGIVETAGLSNTLTNNMFFDAMSGAASQSATAAIMGDQITPGMIAGSLVGGAIGGSLPTFNGVSGGALKNIGTELGYGILKGALIGTISGSVAGLLDSDGSLDGSIQGAANGAKYGALNGFSQAVLTMATFGYALEPTEKVKSKLANMASVASEVGIGAGNNAPVFRSGSVYMWLNEAFGNAGPITLGRNLLVGEKSRGDSDYNGKMWLGEAAHYYQQGIYGTTSFYSKILTEYRVHGYQNSYYVPGTLEYNAHSVIAKNYWKWKR